MATSHSTRRRAPRPCPVKSSDTPTLPTAFLQQVACAKVRWTAVHHTHDVARCQDRHVLHLPCLGQPAMPTRPKQEGTPPAGLCNCDCHPSTPQNDQNLSAPAVAGTVVLERVENDRAARSCWPKLTLASLHAAVHRPTRALLRASSFHHITPGQGLDTPAQALEAETTRRTPARTKRFPSSSQDATCHSKALQDTSSGRPPIPMERRLQATLAVTDVTRPRRESTLTDRLPRGRRHVSLGRLQPPQSSRTAPR